MLIIYTKNRLVNIYFNLLKAYINKKCLFSPEPSGVLLFIVNSAI